MAMRQGSGSEGSDMAEKQDGGGGGGGVAVFATEANALPTGESSETC